MIIICAAGLNMEDLCVLALFNKTNNLTNPSTADYHLPNKSCVLLVSHFESINTQDLTTCPVRAIEIKKKLNISEDIFTAAQTIKISKKSAYKFLNQKN